MLEVTSVTSAKREAQSASRRGAKKKTVPVGPPLNFMRLYLVGDKTSLLNLNLNYEKLHLNYFQIACQTLICDAQFCKF